MTEINKGTIIIDHREQDYFAFALTGNYDHLRKSISCDDIAKFCKGCDCLQENGICRLGARDQARYAARKSCGWASVNKVRGEMTSTGFKAFE